MKKLMLGLGLFVSAVSYAQVNLETELIVGGKEYQKTLVLEEGQSNTVSYPDGTMLEITVEPDQEEVTIRAKVYRENDGDIEVLAQPEFITTWDEQAVLHISSEEKIELSLILVPHKSDQ